MSILLTGAGQPYILSNPLSHKLGSVVIFDNKIWLVCHYDNILNRVYLISYLPIAKVWFGNSGKYKGSTLANYANQYQQQQMSAAALAQCIDVTVPSEGAYGTQYDVTAKVFVPSRDQMSGEYGSGFSWFTNDERRKLPNSTSISDIYWTSTCDEAGGTDGGYVRYVNAGGSLSTRVGANTSNWFRPCICVQL